MQHRSKSWIVQVESSVAGLATSRRTVRAMIGNAALGQSKVLTKNIGHRVLLRSGSRNPRCRPQIPGRGSPGGECPARFLEAFILIVLKPREGLDQARRHASSSVPETGPGLKLIPVCGIGGLLATGINL
jgi:hypothetical protein